MDVKSESTLTSFQQRLGKKWDQNVSRAKFFLYLLSNVRN